MQSYNLYKMTIRLSAGEMVTVFILSYDLLQTMLAIKEANGKVMSAEKIQENVFIINTFEDIKLGIEAMRS